MDSDKRIVMLKLDMIFKKIFGDENHKEIITSFIADILEIPLESIRSVNIGNVELQPEYSEDKSGRLDLKLDVDGRIVNVEMQMKNVTAFKDRTLFYWAKLFGDLPSGAEYKSLRQTVCVNILDFNLFNDYKGYHSHFQVLEKDRRELLTDKFSIHFFELKKLGRYGSGKPVEEWLSLINAEKESDLMAIETTTQNPRIKEVIFKIRELSADEKFRELSFKREKYLHDRASELGDAKEKGRQEGIGIGKQEGIRIGRQEGIGIGRQEGIGIGKQVGRQERDREIILLQKDRGKTPQEIADLLGCTVEEVKKYY